VLSIFIHYDIFINSIISALVPTPSGNLAAASLAKHNKVTSGGLFGNKAGCSLGF
jgi:hypothetical protein